MIYNSIRLLSNPDIEVQWTLHWKQKTYLLKRWEDKKIWSNYNWYGYKDWTRIYILSDEERNQLNQLSGSYSKSSSVDPVEARCKRLCKLTSISMEEAKEIAEEKIEYKEEKINDMESRGYSYQREKLLNKMRRENPLRRIEDKDHAEAILAASYRHNNTDYEYRLDEAREMASIWEIAKEDIKSYARNSYK